MKTTVIIAILALCAAATSYTQWQGRPPAAVTVPTSFEVLKGDGTGGTVEAIPGVDFATVSQAQHSGGVIGTANFKAIGGSISSLVADGVIKTVEYDSNGEYTVTLNGQTDSNYVVSVSLGGNGADDVWGHTIPVAQKIDSGFTLEVRFKGVLSDDSDNIQIAVMRLSR